MTFTSLDEGVGDVTYVYTTADDGTHGLVGNGTPDVTPAPTGVVFTASGIPAEVTIEEAIERFYSSDVPVDFACTWQ